MAHLSHHHAYSGHHVYSEGKSTLIITDCDVFSVSTGNSITHQKSLKTGFILIGNACN